MNIKDAIAILQAAELHGTKEIVFAYWDAESFGMEEGEEWNQKSEQIEECIDWSGIHDIMFEIA